MSNCDCNQGRMPCTCKVSILKETNVGYAASSGAAPVPPAGDVEVQRYDMSGFGDGMIEKADGAFVYFDDHCTIVTRLTAERDAKPRLKIWIGPMPESNGRSNHTVILHSGDITEGICVYRSEYPGRAQYEADAFRHLIGELADKPCPTEYDSDSHSGYKSPKSALEIERDGLLADVALRKAKHLRSCQLAIGKSQLAKQMQSELTKARERIADLERGLKFYADGDHLLLADHDEWDTCSGEPINWLHDNAGTASVEDGSVAKQILNQSAPAAKGGSDE